MPTIGSQSAKEILYAPEGSKEEKQEVAQMYMKTHGNFGPGEQRDRGYQWKVDKENFRFGYGEQKQLDGVAKSVHHERLDEGGFPKTVIVKKTVEDMRAVTADQLGRVKNLGQGKPNIPEDQIFGVRNLMSTDIWNAGKCIHGEPNEKQL
mmetsp:Transcript_41618/g.40005  ORF Transcript_41618/g.40005 Transcript_41618/m.40005 type:complete len:150 (+) Transcript_41618:117-566(+)